MSRSPNREEDDSPRDGEASGFSKMSKRKGADRAQAGSPLKTDNEASPARKERKKKRRPKGSDDDEDAREQNSDGGSDDGGSSPARKRVSFIHISTNLYFKY
tara:strand:+ start:135 stop:440 length:306 start_codon:yes stop_codon:yes gene_type:complete